MGRTRRAEGGPGAGDGPDGGVHGQLVRVIRALAALGLGDLRLTASVRLPDGRLLSTPRPGGGAPPPGELAETDLVAVDPGGRAEPGARWAPPVTIAADLAIYARRPDVNAVVHGQPMTALAFAASGRVMAPVTHTESTLLYPSLPVLGRDAAPTDPDGARALAAALGDRPVAIVMGDGSVAVGGSIAEAGMLTHQVELLARVNEVWGFQPPARGGRVRTVGLVDSDRISAQKAPAADFQDFFDQVAAERTSRPTPSLDDGSEDGLRRRVVAACELLYHHGLIQSLEHVSVRLPDRTEFLMTPRRHLGRLRPEEIAVVGMDGTWRSGPLPPPPFLWLHRDMLAARPEVDAIVHTHQLLVRGLVMAGAEILPLYRGGAAWAAEWPAIHEIPDLMFDAEQRAAALDILGDHRVMHEASHGSDYLAGTVEEATVGALQLERQARLWALASRLSAPGQPFVLGDDVLARLPDEEPDDLAWWRYFRSELPADPTAPRG